MTKNDKTIQQKMTELSTLVSWFNSDQFTLEGALEKFKQAEVMADDIEHDLKNLKNEIEVVKKKFDQ